jgi:hypothetical protein
VGCGSGITLLTLAETFPRSQFDGCDPSRHAIERARDNLTGCGLGNVAFHQQAARQLPPGLGAVTFAYQRFLIRRRAWLVPVRRPRSQACQPEVSAPTACLAGTRFPASGNAAGASA